MSGKKEKRPPQDLTALEDTYRIVGELSARGHVREYLANRLDGGGDVLILVEEPPEGDAGNALTLFAADVNLLATLEHRNLIPIREGRWVGQHAFAVVTERCAAPTIATLIARGESWSYPRIATILHELNGLLEWSRKQKVVHRAVTLETLHLEPDTDRVLASFVAHPLSRQGSPGADGDARTIASIAWSLITRGRELPQSPEDSIGIVRPELPRRVIEATDALMHNVRAGETEPPRVADFIALVAMTDAIARGEMDAAELQAVMHQEQVLEREAWAATEKDLREQLAEQTRQIAEEREQMAQTLAEEREQMAQTLEDERAEMARTIEAEQQRLADERAEMTRTIETERQQLADERAILERELADERTEMAGIIASERQQLADLRAELEERVAADRDLLARDREQHEAEIADERAAMARTIADERAAMAATIADERARMELTLADESERLEQTLAAENERLRAERTEAETALAHARAEFESAMRAQREEFDAQLVRERDEFDRIIIDERNALEAEKEGFAVYHAAEREGIAAERRALEELYLAYEAEGAVVEVASDDDDRARRDRTPGGEERVRRSAFALPAIFGDLAPVAVAQPLSEPEGDTIEPAETESGLTRSDAKRSRRASWGAPAGVLLLVSIITAAAVGVGATRDTDDTAAARAGRPAATTRDIRPSATTRDVRAAAPGAAVVDSAGGAIAPSDSAAALPPDTGAELPAPEPGRRSYFAPTRDTPRPAPVDQRTAVVPRRTAPRAFDTAMGEPASPMGEMRMRPTANVPARDSFVAPPPAIVPTTTPAVPTSRPIPAQLPRTTRHVPAGRPVPRSAALGRELTKHHGGLLHRGKPASFQRL